MSRNRTNEFKGVTKKLQGKRKCVKFDEFLLKNIILEKLFDVIWFALSRNDVHFAHAMMFTSFTQFCANAHIYACYTSAFMFALTLERNFVLQAKRILCFVPLHKHGYLVSGATRNEVCAQALGIIAHEYNEC